MENQAESTAGYNANDQSRLSQVKPAQKSALLPKEVFLSPLFMPALAFWLAAYQVEQTADLAKNSAVLSLALLLSNQAHHSASHHSHQSEARQEQGDTGLCWVKLAMELSD